MRILSVCRGLGIGGMERTVETFTRSYLAAGHEAAVLNLADGGLREDSLRHDGIVVFREPEKADAFDPALIHIHRRGQHDALESAILRRLKTRKRRVIEKNVFAWPDYSPDAALIDVHMLLSRWCLWTWRRRLGRKAPAAVLPNPVRVDRFLPAPPEAISEFRMKWAPSSTFVCGRVAQPLPGKWHSSNILSFVPTALQDPGAVLLLMGLPDSLRPLLARVPSEVSNRIREVPMTASDAELALFYSSLDCFLHAAAQGETFGNVLAEAMACGCPVVTVSLPTRDNSQVELVGHEQGGLVAGSFDDLPRALERLRKDGGLRRRLASGGRRRIATTCNASDVAARAVRIGTVALDHEHRDALRKALEDEPDFVTNVRDDEVEGLAANVMGRRRGTRLMRIVNSAGVHRARQWVRRALRR